MSITSLRKYKIGDRVSITSNVCEKDGIAFPLGLTHQGTVDGVNEHRMCTTCHCTPADPDHAYDGSLCCPGPWYMVAFACPAGDQHRNAFAEHELAPAV